MMGKSQKIEILSKIVLCFSEVHHLAGARCGCRRNDVLVRLDLHLVAQEGMLQQLLSSHPLLGVHLQHPSQQVHGLPVHVLIKGRVQVELALLVALVDIGTGLALEEGPLDQQHVEDNAKREDIAGWVELFPLLARDDFRGHVAGSSTPVEDVVFGVDVCGEPEVDQDGVEASFSSEHDVFGLDVSVHDPVSVDFVEGLPHAPHEALDFFLSEVSHLLVDARVELAVSQKFQDDVDRVIGFEDRLKLHDVGTVEGSKHFNFVEKDLFIDGVGGMDGCGLGEGLGCESGLVGDSLHLVDCGEPSLAQLLDGLVKLMEAILVQIFAQILEPDVQKGFAFEVELDGCGRLLDQPEPHPRS